MDSVKGWLLTYHILNNTVTRLLAFSGEPHFNDNKAIKTLFSLDWQPKIMVLFAWLGTSQINFSKKLNVFPCHPKKTKFVA